MLTLIYGLNYSPELTGIGKYSGELGAWLASQGHEVHVVTAPPYYPDWSVARGYSAWRYQRELIDGVSVYRCPLYVPAQPSTTKRLLHLASFAFSSLFVVLRHLFWRPDVVILVVPTLFCAPITILVARCTGAKCILHVQDYEVDAMFGISMSSSRKGWASNLAHGVERWLLQRFDRVSTISSGMLRRAEQKGVAPQRLLFFPNWSELGHFREANTSCALLQQLGVPADRQVLLYSGNIGEKQGLDLVLQAAVALRERTDLYFLIVGEGAGKALLLQRDAELKLDNLSFAPLQPWPILPTILASAAVHLVIQKRGAADAVLPSKLTNILAVGGNAVITADRDTSLGVMCEQFPGIAVLVAPDSVQALVAGILEALALPLPNTVAMNYADEYLDKEQVLRRFESELLTLI